MLLKIIIISLASIGFAYLAIISKARELNDKYEKEKK